jgi:hypothetical protein
MSHVFAHAVGHAFKEAKHLPKVGEGKNPLIAFCVGFLFGPFGLGLYLQSKIDCIVPLVLILLGGFFTAGIATPLLWMLCGAWGWVRVNNANEAAKELAAPAATASDSQVIHAELVEPEPVYAITPARARTA